MGLFLKMFSKTKKKIYGNLTEKKRSDFFLHEKIWSLGKFQMLFFPQSSIETNFICYICEKSSEKKEENAKFRLFCDATSHLNFISELIFTFLLCLRFNPTPKKAFV